MIRKLILSVLMAVIVFALLNQKTITFIQNIITFNQAHATTISYIIVSIIIFAITYMMLSFSERKGSKEDFFFQVSKHLPRCRNGFIGRPNSFEWSTYGDRTLSCQTINQIKKDRHYGWDGLQNVNRYNEFGGSGCDYSAWSGMGRI